LAHDLPRLDAYVLQAQLGLIAADMAEKLDHALDLEARRAGGHEEGTDAAAALSCPLRIGDSEDDTVVRDRRVGGPDLAAREAPAVAVGPGARRQRRRAGPGTRFREAEAHRRLARHHRRQHALARLVRYLFEKPARPEGPVADDIEHKPVLRGAHPGQ